VKMAFILPGGTAEEQLELALLAEESGWDGVFVWEAPYGVDAWTLLGAIAARTTRIWLGTLLSPLPWRRPWKLASQVVTLDQLSGGRAIITVGLGALEPDIPRTGEPTGLRERADRLDEGIDVMRALWSGEPSFQGHFYNYEFGPDDLLQVGRPVQQRIPIWVVAAWPRPKSMRRVLRCDGVVPQYPDDREGTADDVRALRAWLAERGGSDVDVTAEGETPADDPAAASATVTPFAEAGCTWWMETRWEIPHHSAERMDQTRKRLVAGPPSI
jgi:alkanesulfonate monooxygenase SsuD/methylene tetrahydromethanopterin reductase-like flavin-dependent oxidoreductase (luciferase family)